MPAYLDEEQARRVLDMASVVDALRKIFLEEAAGRATNVPRTRTPVFDRSLNITTATDEASGRFASKIYGAGGSHILLYAKSGGLLAIMDAGWLGAVRTGAASGLATSLMARSDSRRVGLIGAGRQAETQLLALQAIGKLGEVAVYARNRANLEAFCTKMRPLLSGAIAPAESAERAVRGADIVITATKSATPVLRKDWLAPGTHINAMGANSARRMELDLDVVEAASLVVTDDVAQAQKEAGEFIQLAADGKLDWGVIAPLHRLVQSGAPKRDARTITLFKSLGVGLEDLAIASLFYDRVTAGRSG
jgi:alanine dehydrogenase